MNLRMKTGELRFRVSMREYERLLGGEVLKEVILFPDSTQLTFQVVSKDYPNEDYVLNFKNGLIELLLSKDFLRRNKEALEQKEGLVLNEENVRIVFQVDIFSKNKK
ncbi:MAG: hypothetical protein D6780_07120 [Candidatus Dadabacteria bacterium]|nr:MAG: hypothetical protein D6780_07120 [Candidatus Dadabacteria bacterium]